VIVVVKCRFCLMSSIDVFWFLIMRMMLWMVLMSIGDSFLVV